MSMTASLPYAESRTPGFATRFRPALHPVRWFRRRLLRRPGSTMALTLASILGGVITVNALALQTERHPAPLFTALVGDPVTSSIATPPPAPPVAPRAEPARPARSERQEAAKPATVQPLPKDQLQALLRAPAAAEPADAAATQRIMLVQRALNRAGYGPIKEDGAFGPASRQALEKFEADRKLAVRGEPQGRVLRELARASGVVID